MYHVINNQKKASVAILLYWGRFFFLRFYLFEREKAQAGWEAEGEEETECLLGREPDAGLDPRTPSSWSELNVAA